MIAGQSQKVFLLAGPEKGYDSRERLEASTKELTRFGIPYEVIPGDFTEPSGYRAAKQLLANDPQFPIDIFAFMMKWRSVSTNMSARPTIASEKRSASSGLITRN